MSPAYTYLTEAMISLVAAMIFAALWLDLKPIASSEDPEQSSPGHRREPGFFWLSIAMLAWFIKGIGLWMLSESSTAFAWMSREAWVSWMDVTFSGLNNCGLILALVYSDYFPLKFLQNSKVWKVGVMLAFFMISVIALIPGVNQFVHEVEFLFTAFTLGLLTYVFFQSFLGRGLGNIAIVSALSIVLIMLVQFTYIAPFKGLIEISDATKGLLGISSKVFIIIGLLSLAISWVYQGATRPDAKKMSLRFHRIARISGMGNQTLAVDVFIPGHIPNNSFSFPNVPYKEFLKLAIERKYSNVYGDSGWISATTERVGEHLIERNATNYHQIIYRIRKILRIENRGLLIENDGAGNYRLRVNPQNIVFDASLWERPDLQDILPPKNPDGKDKNIKNLRAL